MKKQKTRKNGKAKKQNHGKAKKQNHGKAKKKNTLLLNFQEQLGFPIEKPRFL